MLHIVLYQPQIPPNTGNIIRLAANAGFVLHLIEPLGFSLDEKSLRRAGMDYRVMTQINLHSNWEAFTRKISPKRVFAISTKGEQSVFDTAFESEDVLVFGSETSGLPKTFTDTLTKQQVLRIPMRENNRSLNLANAVSIVSYEACRQAGFPQMT